MSPDATFAIISSLSMISILTVAISRLNKYVMAHSPNPPSTAEQRERLFRIFGA